MLNQKKTTAGTNFNLVLYLGNAVSLAVGNREVAVVAATAGRAATKGVSCTGLLHSDWPAVGAATAGRAATEVISCTGQLRRDRPATGAATAGRAGAATEGVSCTGLLRSDRPPPCPAQTQPRQSSNTRYTDCGIFLLALGLPLPPLPILSRFTPHLKR
jgi:hypothetical protein